MAFGKNFFNALGTGAKNVGSAMDELNRAIELRAQKQERDDKLKAEEEKLKAYYDDINKRLEPTQRELSPDEKELERIGVSIPMRKTPAKPLTIDDVNAITANHNKFDSPEYKALINSLSSQGRLDVSQGNLDERKFENSRKQERWKEDFKRRQNEFSERLKVMQTNANTAKSKLALLKQALNNLSVDELTSQLNVIDDAILLIKAQMDSPEFQEESKYMLSGNKAMLTGLQTELNSLEKERADIIKAKASKGKGKSNGAAPATTKQQPKITIEDYP